MQPPNREPSMEDILASIKKVIAEEKELRTGNGRADESRKSDDDGGDGLDDVLELDQPIDQPIDQVAEPAELGPPLLDEDAAATTRHSLQELSSVAATVPAAPTVNPLEEMIRDMLRPILKEWVDDNLPTIVNDHVKREISRITGRKL